MNLLCKEYADYDDFREYIALDHTQICHFIYNKVTPQKITLTDIANLIASEQFTTPADPALAITFETQLFEMFEEEDTIVDDTPVHYPTGDNSTSDDEAQNEEEEEHTDDYTTVSNLSAPQVNQNKNWSLLILATLYVENEIEITQAKAATLATMNNSTEVEKLKK